MRSVLSIYVEDYPKLYYVHCAFALIQWPAPNMWRWGPSIHLFLGPVMLRHCLHLNTVQLGSFVYTALCCLEEKNRDVNCMNELRQVTCMVWCGRRKFSRHGVSCWVREKSCTYWNYLFCTSKDSGDISSSATGQPALCNCFCLQIRLLWGSSDKCNWESPALDSNKMIASTHKAIIERERAEMHCAIEHCSVKHIMDISDCRWIHYLNKGCRLPFGIFRTLNKA